MELRMQVAERIVLEQREEMEGWRGRVICARREEGLLDLQSDCAQVVIGVRRSGKSTLCMHRLLSDGVAFGYINFDDERLYQVGSGALDTLLSAVYTVYGNVERLFLDEIQNVEGWPLFVNRLLRGGKKVVLTGSNAKLLSGELATHLTGRSHTISLFPFSFGDVVQMRELTARPITALQQGLLREAFGRFLRVGGFPQVVKETERVESLIPSLLENILQRDICERYAVRQVHDFRTLSHHLLNTVPTVLNVKALSQRFEESLSPSTIRKYVEYLKQCFLLIGIQKYSRKSHLRLRNEKLYPVDVGFLQSRPNALAGENWGWRLECVVLHELLRRCSVHFADVYYYQEGQTEVDFVVCQGDLITQAIQVSYDLSAPKTRAREVRALQRFSEKYPQAMLLLLTDDVRESVTLPSGKIIEILPTSEWLLEQEG